MSRRMSPSKTSVLTAPLLISAVIPLCVTSPMRASPFADASKTGSIKDW